MTQTTTLHVEPVGDRAIRIVRSFRAPRQLVFDAHTEPELLKRWLGPASWTLTESDVDLRVGGTYRHVMDGPDGARMVLHGEFRAVDAPSRLVTTEAFDDDWTGGETLNTTTFDEVGGITTVTVFVEYASAASRDGALASGMEGGMAEGFDRLDALLADGRDAAADHGDVLARYRRRADRFEALVTGADPARWDDPSPCAGWRARDVVGHIVDMHAVMLRPLGRELSPAPTVGDDPVAAFRAARADVEAILTDPDLAATPCETPMGPMSLAEHVDGVVSTDLVLHAWDLARAVGLDDAMDPDEVARMWPTIQDIPDEMRIPDHFGPGVVVFGPEVPVPADASTQDRLLGKIGRDPGWVRPASAGGGGVAPA
jgi:uncharacterized protein (TIGR03086 family)